MWHWFTKQTNGYNADLYSTLKYTIMEYSFYMHEYVSARCNEVFTKWILTDTLTILKKQGHTNSEGRRCWQFVPVFVFLTSSATSQMGLQWARTESSVHYVRAVYAIPYGSGHSRHPMPHILTPNLERPPFSHLAHPVLVSVVLAAISVFVVLVICFGRVTYVWPELD